MQVCPDHMVVTALFQGMNMSGCLARWYFTIQEFVPRSIKYLPGHANVVAYALSSNVSVVQVTVIPDFSFHQLRDEERKDRMAKGHLPLGICRRFDAAIPVTLVI